MEKKVKLVDDSKKYCKKNAKKFKKDMTIGEALQLCDGVEEVLTGFGMHCFTCPFSLMETLEQAAAVHGVEVDFMLSKLNELIK